ncbi:MAG: SGNH/GDSL hydrolase family protein [Xanthobacteraceae bacterium]
MKFNKQTKISSKGWTAAASAFFVALQFAAAHTAHAQVSALAQHIVSQAAPGSAASAAKAVSSSAASALACTAPPEFVRFDRPLLHTMRRLASGQLLTIVAIGSSSTAGAGATSPEANYPSRLGVELRAKFPSHEITVLNRGVNGEETDNMMARFASDVIAAHPQLVLWQIGTNSVLRDHPLGSHNVELREGIEELKNSGTDVVLIDPQFAPAVLAKSETPGMVDQIALAAKEENVDLFRRFAVMRDWHDVQNLSFDTFVSPDHLHMNDWSYACVAKLLGTAIAEAATRPIAAASVHQNVLSTNAIVP